MNFTKRFGAKVFTCLFLWLTVPLAGAMPALADDVFAMRQALQRAEVSDWSGALALAPKGVGRNVIDWMRLRDGQGNALEYASFVAQHSDWPGLPLLREKGEEAIASNSNADLVIAYFNGSTPQTGAGAVALVRAYIGKGRPDFAKNIAMLAWVNLDLDTQDEETLYTLFGQDLAGLNQLRHERLLWEQKHEQAVRMLRYLPNNIKPLTMARVGLQAQKPGVDALILAVPSQQAEHPGLAYDRFNWRMRKNRYVDAASIIIERSQNVELLGNAAVWADRREILSRWLLRNNRVEEAYLVASRHHLFEKEGGSSFAALEFLAGYIALRQYNSPERAIYHFKRLEAGVASPISKSRAHYWLGRAYEMSGENALSRKAYKEAAKHQTTYYGLLAAEHLQMSTDVDFSKEPPKINWRGAKWAGSSVHKAALLLLNAGDIDLAKRFWLHLGESQNIKGLEQLGAMAKELNQPHIMVLIGKAAAQRGETLHHSLFPVTDIVPERGIYVSRALSLAVARRESEFNPSVISYANAKGMMQLMPATAKHISRKIGVSYNAQKLLSDPAYNAQLGTAYLAELVDEFGTSVALVAAAYNAGPARARSWIKQFGDPRDENVDVVDWVESIPFSETRSYVMRVVEGVVVYRAKLRGRSALVNITQELKG